MEIQTIINATLIGSRFNRSLAKRAFADKLSATSVTRVDYDDTYKRYGPLLSQAIGDLGHYGDMHRYFFKHAIDARPVGIQNS